MTSHCESNEVFSKWDDLISNSYWFVPIPYLLAYIASGSSLINRPPLPFGDQTLWSIGPAKDGQFAGTSTTSTYINKQSSSSSWTLAGTVTPEGHVRITFHPADGGAPTVGLGRLVKHDGPYQIVMQMLSTSSLVTTHWAYMTPYDPAIYAPPAAELYSTAVETSPAWSWVKGTTWAIKSESLFGSTDPGLFRLTDYSSGYFWGDGTGPACRKDGTFTEIGSITPEGNVIFGILMDGALTSLIGMITGDASNGRMELRSYDGSDVSAIATVRAS
jgi:hypothetical protein